MKTLSTLIAASLSTAFLAGCGSPGSFASQTVQVNPLSRSHRPASLVQANTGGATLYVLNDGGGQEVVSIYATGESSPLRTMNLGANKYRYVYDLAVDPVGHLYTSFPASQSGPQNGPGVLDVYINRGAKLLRSLHQPHPFALLTFDGSGNLFTYCAGSRLCEYASAKQKVIRRIALRKVGGGGNNLAVDRSGNLAVGGFNGPVLVFAPGATQPYWTIQGGINQSTALAFDSGGNLYVTNAGGTGGNVAVYAPGGTSPMRTITDGIAEPSALAFDGSGNLYVLNYCVFSSNGCHPAPAVTEYAPDGSVPVRTITDGVEGGGGLGVDRSGNLYVANAGSELVSPPDPGSITVYAPNGSSPIRTITKGIQNPVVLGVGQ